MSVVRAQIEIAATPEEVWDVIMDIGRADEWVTIHRGLKGHSDGPLRVGYEMHQTLSLRGARFDVHWKLTELDAPHHAVWEGRGPARSKAYIEDTLTADNGGTRFDYVNEFRAPLGALGAVASRALVGGLPDKEANASLRQLKQLIEG